MINVLNSVQLAFTFASKHLLHKPWWDAIARTPIPDSDKQVYANEFANFIKVGFVHALFSSIESSLRIFLRALDPAACNGGMAEFKSIYNCLFNSKLTAAPRDGGQLLDLLRLVPFIVGVFTHVAFCVHLERISHNQFVGSFITFYPQYFDGMYGFGGNFAWMGLHLWYLQMLFLFTLVCFPLFLLLKGIGRSFLGRLGDLLAKPGVVLLLILPVFLLYYMLDPHSFVGMREWGG